MGARSIQVEPLVWGDDNGFLSWFKSEWEPGQHVSVIAPTGAGKTTFVGGLLGMRRYVVALDPKGGDTNLSNLGYPRLPAWPGEKRLEKMVADHDERGEPSRYIIGPKVSRHEDLSRLRSVTKNTLDGCFNMGGWTVYGDELQILTDPRMMNLRTEVDRILISARDKGISFVSAYQAPSWVTPQASKQATWCAVSYTRDTDVVNRLAEILGRPKPEIRGAIGGLDPYTWIMVGRNPREPLRVTLPDEIFPPRPGETTDARVYHGL